VCTALHCSSSAVLKRAKQRNQVPPLPLLKPAHAADNYPSLPRLPSSVMSFVHCIPLYSLKHLTFIPNPPFLTETSGVMDAAGQKDGAVVLGLHMTHQANYSESTPLCSILEMLIPENDHCTISATEQGSDEKLIAKITKLESDLERLRQLLYAAEDIIIDQRVSLADAARVRHVQDRSPLLTVSLACNVAAAVSLCVCMGAYMRSRIR
jgi:hypothetical protein